MSRLLKKIALVLILFLGFISASAVSPRSAKADPRSYIKAVQEGNNLQWYLGANGGMLSTTADALFVGIIGARDENGELIQAGAIDATSNMMASLYKQPVSSRQYVAYLLNNSGLVKPSFAQGRGIDFLTLPSDTSTASPLLVLWKNTRNTAYLFFIVIFVAIGFMVMFRSKLNPQTTINLQMAIPRIVVSLILVTFSFAICGLIVDSVYLGHNLIGQVYFSSAPLKIAGVTLDYVKDVNSLDILSTLFAPSPGSTWAGISVFSQIADFISNVAEALDEGTFLSTIFIPLILAFTLLGTGVKIFFSLITKYVTIILSTIFSPLVFLLSAFPGKPDSIANFLKTILSASLTFPAVAFMFFLSSYFASDANLKLEPLPPLNKEGVLAEPIITSAGGFAFDGRVLEPLIALGILMATVQVPQAIDQALGVKAGIAGAATPDVSGALRKIPLIGSLLG